MFDGLGVFAVLFIISIIVFVPLFLTVIMGILFANMLGLSGVLWWCFVLFFYLIVTCILCKNC